MSNPSHDEIIVYLKEVASRLRDLRAGFERKNKTLKTKAAISTIGFLDDRVVNTIINYEEDPIRYKMIDLQIQKLIYEDIVSYWEKVLK